MNALINVAYFLVDTLFTLYLVLIVVRLLLGITRADFYNPLSQFIVKATNPVIVPLRRILPPIGKIDTAGVFVLFVIKLIQVTLLELIKGANPDIASILASTVIGLIELCVYVLIFAIIIQAVMSWVNPTAHGSHNPMLSVINSLTRPVVDPIRKFVPPVGGFDLSPLVALLLLQIVLIVLP